MSAMRHCSVSTMRSFSQSSASVRPRSTRSRPTASSVVRSRTKLRIVALMGFEPAPFDVVEASRRVWLERWEPEAASGMAVYTAILRSYQLLNDQVNSVMRNHDLTFARYEVLTWLATDPESSLTLSWISKTLRIPPATVTNIIDRLEQDRLVRRGPHPSDAGTTPAGITAPGPPGGCPPTRGLHAR